MSKITLSRPVKAHGNDVTVLEFREPTGDDILACGMPFNVSQRTDGTSLQIMDMPATYAYIVALAGIPMSSAKAMKAPDVIKAYGAIAGFFGEAPETTIPEQKPSSDTTN